MPNDATHTYLCSQLESLEPLDFVALAPSGNALLTVQAGRGESGDFLVVVPARPPGAPSLPDPIRASLGAHGFAPIDADEPAGAWIRDADGADSAAALARKTIIEVFGAKADQPLDIVHGSRQGEYEVRRKLALIRVRIEQLLTAFIGSPPEQDSDGDFQLPIADVRVTVAPRSLPGGPVVIRIFAVTNTHFNTTPELGLFLARLNFGLMFGRFALDIEHNAIWFDETLLGEHFSDEELRFAVQVVASTADEWDDRIKQMFGGATYQETLALADDALAAPVKPGHGGTGFYL